MYFVYIETNCLGFRLTALPTTNLNNIQHKVWAWPVLFITVKQTVTFGTHCLSWRHIVWLSHKLSNSETSCPILRQADWSWNKASNFETGYLVLSNYCISCLVSGQTVQALDWLYCHASLWRNCGLPVIPHSKPHWVCYASSHLLKTLCRENLVSTNYDINYTTSQILTENVRSICATS